MPTQPTPDPEAFRAFEHEGWESNVSDYDAAFGRITRQSIGPLLDAVGVRPGIRLLDVATGPGYAASVASARGAQVTGIDFSASMVDRARADVPQARFEVGDAEGLSFPAASFDAVIMNFGMLHLARPELAMREARRVLVPGGRFAFTVWAGPDETVCFKIILGLVQSLGNPNVPLPEGPSFFRFSDPAECERVLVQAGFEDVKVARVPQVWHFDAPEQPFDAIYNGGVRIRALLRAQTPEARKAIRDASCEATSKYLRDGAIELPMPAVLASATKPA